MLWRSLGHSDANGTFVPPVSFLEAQTMPQPMLEFFMKLDDVLAIMQKQDYEKKFGKRK